MVSAILSRLVILLFGTLYPAYASYKAVRTKNVKEYVKWMMYWIVFALFTCVETFTDIFLSWFPFYYGIKIILVIWLLSPATKGSSILYRKFVHPALSCREHEIDEYITKAKEQSYRQVLDLGSKGVSALMQTAIKSGGGIVNQLKKSYSLSDLTDPCYDQGRDETDDILTDPRLRRRRSPHRSSSSTSAVYFSEVDIRSDRIASIQSVEDISSGYSSGEGLYPGHSPKILGREPVHRTGSLTRSRSTRTTTRSSIPRKATGSDDSDDNEEFDTNIVFHDGTLKDNKIMESSSSETEYLDTLDTIHDNLGEDTENCDKVQSITACTVKSHDASSITNNTSVFPAKSVKGDYDSFSKLLQGLMDMKNEKFKAVEETKTARNSFEPENVDSVVSAGVQRNDEEVNEPAKEDGCAAKCWVAKDAKCEKSGRGGRYNKKSAPAPPIQKSEVGNPIKAKLVLQPGIVKAISSEELSCKNIFIQSPRSSRRSSVNRSHSSISFSKLMKLPKKIGFWNKEASASQQNREHRFSWHGFFNTEPSYATQHSEALSNSKSQSKSYSNLTKESPLLSLHGSNKFRSSSQTSIKTLRDSPSATRRLRVMKKYVDEDII